MAESSQSENSFAKVFIPGLVIGLLVGMAIGVLSMSAYLESQRLQAPNAEVAADN